MDLHCTYLIVGAGLAGSTCAFLLKRAGADVLLVESQALSRKSKLCAGLVTPRAQDELRRIYGIGSECVFRQSITTLRAVTDEIEVMVRSGLTKSVHRADLDRYAVNAYRDIGGRVVDQLRLHSIDFRRRMAHGRVAKMGEAGAAVADIEPFTCSFDVLIAADGALSWTRRQATGAPPNSILTLEAEVPNNGAPYTMAFNSGFFGYSWFAPAGRTAKIGCGSFSPASTARDLQAQLSAFCDYIGVAPTRPRGAYIPVGDDVLLLARRERTMVYLLGDAASLVCPPSGEGIFFALHSARMLAHALLTGSSYVALMKPHVQVIAREFKTRDMFFNRAFMRAGLWFAGHSPYGEERAVKFALKHFVSFE